MVKIVPCLTRKTFGLGICLDFEYFSFHVFSELDVPPEPVHCVPEELGAVPAAAGAGAEAGGQPAAGPGAPGAPAPDS